ncbi:hypothetical protein L6164_005928 [Bauhinia variegata]|uniref:Uncharacterized protein n=1 Tax=Bauhinia variegata TaxID=167791 RepID=A0ACB9PS33_BAUVA|nr:hypothetical protein L6164_005928 [Bauhinia variegata]
MEFFNAAQAVRLRSHLGKYLVADDDEETVRQSRNGSSHKARWRVELVEGHCHVIHLKSCFGKYLTASEEPFLLGMTGKKVLQTMPATYKDISIDWEPIKEGIFLMLRAKSGMKFLRANGGTPPWRNSVTHDLPHRTATKDWVLWEVEAVNMEDESVKGYISPTSSFSSSYSDDFETSDQCSDNGSPIAFANYNVGFSSPEPALKSNTGDQSDHIMELFQKAKSVRFRSHHDKYLLAHDDEETVCQHRNGVCPNAKWIVEIVENHDVIRLKSCYGKYLTASNMPFLLGATGKKVLQTLPTRLDSSLEWEPIREGVQVRLKTRYGQYLRANKGLPPWRNSITHDIPHRSSTKDWILWDVDVLEIRPEALSKPRQKPQPIMPPEYSPSDHSHSLISGSNCSLPIIEIRSPRRSAELKDSEENSDHSPIQDGRIIYFDVGDEKGFVEEANKGTSFTFKGSSVQELKEKLQELTLLDDILVCSRNPLNGKLYPLRLQLPPNNARMHVIVVPSSYEVQ